ncbi:MAG: hypothetical protein JNK48_24155 [Bryobacterales bacterium]|nr:hypothetical protein [Bryobacterales bacterium]
MRTVMRGNGTILVYVNGVRYHKVTDSSIAVGQPGFGGYGFIQGGWSNMTSLRLGPLDRIAPAAVSSTGFAVTALANNVDIQWTPTADDTNGTGVYSYNVYRNGVFIGETPPPLFADAAVSPATGYTHAVEVVDLHGNASSQYSFNVTTAPAGSIEPRRTGVRSEGSYWGGGGEQIDMRSGNLNFTLGLVRAQGRGGWGVPLGLSYNSQNWRKDVATWRFGRDVGYGFGWRLMAGAITPIHSNLLTVHHYVFTDATGAEYRLDINTSGVWTSSQGAYVSYVEATNRLYFNNGSFWVMGALSGGTEDDAGSRYPTRIQDSNGNYVDIRYMTGLNAAYSNSSARISQVEDVRASTGGATYTFTYNSDPITHITGISNSINKAETYSFTYTVASTLSAPFAGSGTFGTAQMLQIVTQTGPSLSHTFEYIVNGAGELTKVTLPFQGELRWTHSEFTFAGNRAVREVTQRQLVKQNGATPWTYSISHPSGDTAYSTRSQATLDDPSGTGQRVWYFTTAAGFTQGLVWKFEQKHMPGAVVKRRQEYTWVQDGAGRPYIGTVLATADPGQTYQKQSKTEQTLDVYGNVTQRKEYAYGNLSTPARTFNNTYLNSSTYLNGFVRNRLSTAQVTNGSQTATLATITYDTHYGDALPTTPEQWTAPASVRGIANRVVTPATTRDYRYDQTGTLKVVMDELGRYVETTNSQAKDYAVPAAVTPNGDTSMQETYTWNAFLGLTQDAAPNGAVSTITYDASARPQSVTSPHGAVSTYAYTNSPPTVTVTTSLRWVKTTMDGLGRTIKVERGYNGGGGGTKSTVDTEYEPCACSPFGKVKRVSLLTR